MTQALSYSPPQIWTKNLLLRRLIEHRTEGDPHITHFGRQQQGDHSFRSAASNPQVPQWAPRQHTSICTKYVHRAYINDPGAHQEGKPSPSPRHDPAAHQDEYIKTTNVKQSTSNQDSKSNILATTHPYNKPRRTDVVIVSTARNL